MMCGKIGKIDRLDLVVRVIDKLRWSKFRIYVIGNNWGGFEMKVCFIELRWRRRIF